MDNTTILKNKNLTIKVKFSDKIKSYNENKYFEYSAVDISSGDNKGKYINKGEGEILKDAEEKPLEMGITLENLALDEKRKFYKRLFQSQYKEIENIVVLSGAGSSVGIGKEKKGHTMAGLWDELYKRQPDCLIKLITETEFHGIEDGKIVEKDLNKDLEALLSKAGMKSIINKKERENETELEKAIIIARQFISDECTLTLPDDAPHISFLNKVLLRPQKYPRVKIFTLNYDTLFEQAAGKQKFTVIDGFTFSSPRVFNGKYFDYDIIETRHNRQDKKDSTISKLFYLFKMHGSLNWKKDKTEIVQFDGDIEVKDRVMIFPQDSKYEYSYEQPFFEMMARFQQALRTENTLLITIGFSFLDKHISSVILESIKQIPSLNLMAFTFPEVVDGSENAKQYQKELHNIIEFDSRVTLIADKFEDLAKEYPENIAHNRLDVLEQLTENLKKLSSEGK